MNKLLKFKWQEIKEEKVWHNFLASHPELEANFTQSFAWGLYHEKLGQKIFRRGCFDHKGQQIAGYTAVLEVGKYYRFLSITGGPLLNWQNQSLAQSLAQDLKNLGQSIGVVYIRFRPAGADNPALRQILSSLKSHLSPMGLSVELAGILDLNLSPQELLKGMSKSIRYKIRKVEQDPKIKIRTSTDSKDAQIFVDLHHEHARAQKYVPFPKKKILTQFKIFAERHQAELYIAERKGQVLASNMMFFYGQEASHHYGISTSLGQKYPAAPSLHLAAMLDAKERGLKIYNFWGIVKPHQTRHRYYGLSEFKRRFGVTDYQYVPAHDFVIRPFFYGLTWVFEVLRRRWRRL